MSVCISTASEEPWRFGRLDPRWIKNTLATFEKQFLHIGNNNTVILLFFYCSVTLMFELDVMKRRRADGEKENENFSTVDKCQMVIYSAWRAWNNQQVTFYFSTLLAFSHCHSLTVIHPLACSTTTAPSLPHSFQLSPVVSTLTLFLLLSLF